MSAIRLGPPETITAAAEPRKRLQAVEVRPVGPQGSLGQVAHVVARLDRIETS